MVTAEPVDESKSVLVGSIHRSEGFSDEYWGKRFVITSVLAGTGVEAGDEVQATWLSPRVEIRDAKTGDVAEVAVGGDGYAEEVSAPRYIFGLSRELDFVEGENPWGVVSSAHGMVAFERADGDRYVIAEPEPGQDGSLQTALRGRTFDDVTG